MLSKMCLRSFQITPTNVALVSNMILLGSSVISFKFSFASPASLSVNLNPMYLQTQTLQFRTSSETTAAHYNKQNTQMYLRLTITSFKYSNVLWLILLGPIHSTVVSTLTERSTRAPSHPYTRQQLPVPTSILDLQKHAALDPNHPMRNHAQRWLQYLG